MHLSRRQLGFGFSAIAGTAIANKFPAYGATIKKRWSATTPEGKAMLALYAHAVKEMKKPENLKKHSSWAFQWYTHFVDGTTNKETELDRIFGSGESDAKYLASVIWDTCQAHGGVVGAYSPNFLPWHRAYLFYFEEVVRGVLSNDDFTMPYWDYTMNDVLPEEFRKPDDSKWAALYVKDRNDGVNTGTPIRNVNGVIDERVFSHELLNIKNYLPSGSQLGFNRVLDRGLHGAIHVQVGTASNMGDIPYAANDPIFWLHHCNIDRFWAAWNRSGKKNPNDSDWLNRSHKFADRGGNIASKANRELVEPSMLGYEYDTYPDVPAVLAAASGSSAIGSEKVLASSTAGVALKPAGAAAVVLVPSSPTAASALKAAGAANKRYFVAIGNLTTNAQPGVGYKVYVAPSGTTIAEAAKGKLVGSINFFDAGRVAKADETPDFVFEVTDVVRGAAASSADPLTYFIVPNKDAAAGSDPVVGKVDLIER